MKHFVSEADKSEFMVHASMSYCWFNTGLANVWSSKVFVALGHLNDFKNTI